MEQYNLTSAFIPHTETRGTQINEKYAGAFEVINKMHLKRILWHHSKENQKREEIQRQRIYCL